MDEKYYKTTSQRIEILKDRNINIRGNATNEKSVIKHNNYYNLINGYKHLFLDKFETGKSSNKGKDIFKTGTKPSELYAVMQFDNQLRTIFLKKLLIVEEKIKHAIVQSFYNTQTGNDLHKHNEYKKSIYYDTSRDTFIQKTYRSKLITETEIGSQNSSNNQNSNIVKEKEFSINRYSEHSEFSSNVTNEIEKQQNKKDSIKYYQEQHGYIPYWVLTNILSLGTISHLFIILKENTAYSVMDRLGISHSNTKVDIYNFYKILGILTLGRNICAHNERFYCFKHSYTIDDKFMEFGKALPHYTDPNNNTTLKPYQKMKKTKAISGIYSLIFSLLIFFATEERQKFVKKLNLELDRLSKKLNTISIDDVKKDMGINFDMLKNVEEIPNNYMNILY